MNELNYPETTKYVIVHDNKSFVYHVVEPQHCFSTGQPYMEVFNTKEEWEAKIAELALPLASQDSLGPVEEELFTSPLSLED